MQKITYTLLQFVVSNWQLWFSFHSSEWEINEKSENNREQREDEVGWP